MVDEAANVGNHLALLDSLAGNFVRRHPHVGLVDIRDILEILNESIALDSRSGVRLRIGVYLAS